MKRWNKQCLINEFLMEKNDFLNFQTAVKLHGILHKNQRNIFDVIELKKKNPSAGQINNESINKR